MLFEYVVVPVVDGLAICVIEFCTDNVKDGDIDILYLFDDGTGLVEPDAHKELLSDAIGDKVTNGDHDCIDGVPVCVFC